MRAWQQRAVVTYKVWGKAGGSYMTIRYLDTPSYGLVRRSQCKVVQVPANQLPWAATVRLPHNSYAFMKIENEPSTKSAFWSSITIDGDTITQGGPDSEGIIRKFESSNLIEWIYRTEYYRRHRHK